MYREQRIVTACPVEFPRLDRVVQAESEDLSRRGVFVRTEELLPVGDIVELTITLPDESHVRVISRVAHLLSPSAARALGRRSGMGFEFLEQENDGRDQLIRYLEDVMEELTPPPQELPGTTHVLVVDNSPRLLDRLSTSLGDDGFVVTTAANGAEAYAICQEQAPHIIVCEAEMPVMDGWTLVKMVMARHNLAEVPFVMMSEDAGDMTRLKAYRLGVRDFVHKPFTDEEMCIRLRRLALPKNRMSRSPTMLNGNLTQIGIPTLLSLLEFERKSGILVVLRNEDAARLFVANGRVVKVEGPRDGLEPFERILAVLDWNDGNFEFASCEVVGEDEVGMPTATLLLEHARMHDERAIDE